MSKVKQTVEGGKARNEYYASIRWPDETVTCVRISRVEYDTLRFEKGLRWDGRGNKSYVYVPALFPREEGVE